MKRAEAFLLDLNLAAALGVVALACVLVYRRHGDALRRRRSRPCLDGADGHAAEDQQHTQ